MDRYARLAGALDLEIIPTGRPFSNFDYVDQHFRGLLTLRRVFSQARLHDYKTLVVERLGPSDDLSEENDDIANRKGRRVAQRDVAVLRRTMPKRLLWLVELSVPELFAGNRRKVAEVLLDAETAAGQKCDGRSFVIARLPGYFALLAKTSGSSGLTFQFLPNPVTGHVALYGAA